ncbi:MAG: YdcF family protein [Patescibacteria group bacterium]
MERGLNTVNSITNFVFAQNPPSQADVIIVPGSSHRQLALTAVKLYKKRLAKKIIFTGGFNQKLGKSEADFGTEIALKKGVPDIYILRETKSKNTKENALQALVVIKKHKLAFKKILLISKPYHARRLKMTFSKVFPRSQLFVIPIEDDRKINRHNWWKSAEGIAKVMEELEKISQYYNKGDLSLNYIP